MKLEDIKIASSPLTDRMYLGIVSKKDAEIWASKVDCTSLFLGALMNWTPPGTIRVVNDNNGNQYEIEVRKIESREC